MWTREELKTNAKATLKQNYWKSVLAGLVLSICVGSGAAAAGQSGDNEDWQQVLNSFGEENVMTLLAVALSIVGVALLVNFVVRIFIWNPLEVGCERFFLRCSSGDAVLKDLVFALGKGRGHTGMVMFQRTLFTSLWSLLFVVPGIVKSYEYMMIPYLLADDSSLTAKEAFARSKAMMDGNKWQAFVLDFSFIGWQLLSVVTLGLVGLFYVEPYLYHTHAQLYLKLKSAQ